MSTTHGRVPRDDSASSRSRIDTPAAQQTDPVASAPGNKATGRLIRSAGAGGLPVALRRSIEQRLGQDLGDVRLHTNSDAAAAAADVEAEAFTTGDDIVLGGNAPRPGTPEGDHLLEHELAHVVQQRRASTVIEGVSSPHDAAESAADAVAHGAPLSNTGAVHAVHAVQRQAVLGKERVPIKREDVKEILTDYLERALHEQGGQAIQRTPEVVAAISLLFQGNPVMQGSVESWLRSNVVDGTPAGLAQQVVAKLPDVIPEDNLKKIRGSAKQPATPYRPKTAADAAGSVVVDSTVAPLVKNLGLSKDKQDKVIEAARSAVGSGGLAVLDAALDAVGIGGSSKSAIHAAVEGAIKQEPGKAMDRQQDGAGSPYRQEQPPSAAPSNASAPGEHIFKSPSIPWEFPGVKKPAPRPAPLPKTDPEVDKAIATVDPNVMVPAEVRGTERADEFGGGGQEFARDVAKRLEAAQGKKDGQVTIEIGAQYAGIKDRRELMSALKAVVFKMRDALGHHASLVERVNFTINGRISYSFSLHPSAD
jgi:Domain of unknown function (DUF4157)